MKPAPPTGWVNHMEVEEKQQKVRCILSDPSWYAIGLNGGEPCPQAKAESWESGLMGCCNDKQACCVGLCCPCVLYGWAKEHVGEDKIGNSIAFALALPMPCTLVFFFRENLRAQYKFETSVCLDLLASCLCFPCAPCPSSSNM